MTMMHLMSGLKIKNMKKITIYTDGACKGNPGLGGWGVFMEHNSQVTELHGGEPATTNNRMELTAVIKALQALTEPCKVDLYLDSQYVRMGITEWITGWKKRNWRSSTGTPVKNRDLWEQLDALVLSGNHELTWHWVRGHTGNSGNERADALANQGADAARVKI